MVLTTTEKVIITLYHNLNPVRKIKTEPLEVKARLLNIE